MVLIGRRMTGVSLEVANFIRKYSNAGGMVVSRKWSEMPRDKVTNRSQQASWSELVRQVPSYTLPALIHPGTIAFG